MTRTRDDEEWETVGHLGGQPESVLAADDVLYASATGRGILASRDGGRTWAVHFAPG
jgi:hypothetical protein